MVQQARRLVDLAKTEADRAGSSTIEAEHLLLAIASDDGSRAQALLASAGLSHYAITVALTQADNERVAPAGVRPERLAELRATSERRRDARIGRTTKTALHHAVLSSDHQPLEAEHVLIGVLSDDTGTVPRALEIAGVERATLLARLRRALS